MEFRVIVNDVFFRQENRHPRVPVLVADIFKDSKPRKENAPAEQLTGGVSSKGEMSAAVKSILFVDS